MTEKQKAARKLASDYLGYLTEQEELVSRLVDRRLNQMAPQIEQRISQIIDERLSAALLENNRVNKP